MQEPVEYTIIAANGTVIATGICNAATQQLSSGLEQGVYIVRLSKNDNENSSAKVTIR